MSRKVIIVVLLLTSSASAVLWGVSFVEPVTWWSTRPAEFHRPTTAEEARRPVCYECQWRDGRLALARVYTLCGNQNRSSFSFAGIEYSNQFASIPGANGPAGDKVVLSFPGWLVPLVFLSYPAIAFCTGPLRRRRRRRSGLCVRCGYDLRGNVPGVCSECGCVLGK